MQRWCMILVILCAGSTSLAQWEGPATAEEIEHCGTPGNNTRGTGAFMGSATATVWPYCGIDGRWRAFWDSDGSQRYSWSGGGFPDCDTGGQINGHTDREGHLNGVLTCEAMYPAFDAAEPEPPLPDSGDGWDCDTYNDGSQFCWKYEDDVWHVSWQTPCGVFYGETMDPAEGQQWAADFDASRNEDCSNPLPSDPNMVECIGADGLACESTLQEVLYELRMMRHAEETPAVQPPVVEIELDLGEVTVPSFDRHDPEWEGWVAPEFTELEQSTITDRVESGLIELRNLAETKFPFGMVTWVPTGSVGGGGTCTEPQLALMGTEARGIGWCDSAMESFIAGFGRAALVVLMTIGFGFGVVRTVSLS